MKIIINDTEKIAANHMSKQELVFKIHKGLSKPKILKAGLGNKGYE